MYSRVQEWQSILYSIIQRTLSKYCLGALISVSLTLSEASLLNWLRSAPLGVSSALLGNYDWPTDRPNDRRKERSKVSLNKWIKRYPLLKVLSLCLLSRSINISKNCFFDKITCSVLVVLPIVPHCF